MCSGLLSQCPLPAHSYEEHEPDAVEDITVTYYKNKQTDATSEANKAQSLNPSPA